MLNFVTNSKKIKIIINITILSFLFVTTAVASSNSEIHFDPGDYTINGNLQPSSAGDQLNLGQNSPLAISMQLLWIISSILGLAFLILIIYAGATWMLAHGNEQEIEKAKTIIRHSIIGLIITLLSVSIAYLIYELIRYAMTE